VTRLLAPNFQSTTGVTLGRQTFDGTPDGKAQGNAFGEEIAPASGLFGGDGKGKRGAFDDPALDSRNP